LYEKGYGVQQDHLKAMDYYQKSAEKGNDSALKNIGILYEKGYGVQQDHLKAMDYYQQSAEKGNQKAKELYKAIVRKIEAGYRQ